MSKTIFYPILQGSSQLSHIFLIQGLFLFHDVIRDRPAFSPVFSAYTIISKTAPRFNEIHENKSFSRLILPSAIIMLLTKPEKLIKYSMIG